MAQELDLTDIQTRFLPPPALKWGHFKNGKGKSIRYAHTSPKGTPKATVVLLQGFRQSIEEYFEVMHDMLDRGFAVWTFDWRGQGGSDRYIPAHPQRMHSEGYEEQMDVLRQFLADIVVHKQDTPLFAMAHSMGAHIALRYLKEKEPQAAGRGEVPAITAMVLTAPMMDMKTWGFPKPLARLASKFMRAAQSDKQYVLTGSNWQMPDFATNKWTTCPVRFSLKESIYLKNATLRMGAPTYGWLNETFKSVGILNVPSYLHAIKTPILMQVSGKEGIVEPEQQVWAYGFLPNAEFYQSNESKHEIWLERNSIRSRWLERLDNYLAPFLGAAPAPVYRGPSV